MEMFHGVCLIHTYSVGLLAENNAQYSTSTSQYIFAVLPTGTNVHKPIVSG
jgi:hypothetical protein